MNKTTTENGNSASNGEPASRIDDRGLDMLFRSARSYNGYFDRDIPDGLLEELWELTSLGPTSANMSPARIVWVRTPEAKDMLAALASSANARKIHAAPVTAIVGMDLDFADKLPQLFPHVDARPWFTGSEEIIEVNAMRNSTLQGAYLLLAARALGLDAGPMSGFDNAGVDAAFFAGTRIRSNFIMTLGYGDPASLFERLPRLGFAEATQYR